MEISIFDENTFDIHVDLAELILLHTALDSVNGPDYYFMAKEIMNTIQEVRPKIG